MNFCRAHFCSWVLEDSSTCSIIVKYARVMKLSTRFERNGQNLMPEIADANVDKKQPKPAETQPISTTTQTSNSGLLATLFGADPDPWKTHGGNFLLRNNSTEWQVVKPRPKDQR